MMSQDAVPPLAELLAALDERSALVRAADREVEEAKLRIRVAELEGLPDVDLGLGYRVRRSVPGDPVDGDDFISAGLTLRLPVDRPKWRARVAERRSLLRRAEADLRGVRAALVAQTRHAHAELVRDSSRRFQIHYSRPRSIVCGSPWRSLVCHIVQDAFKLF